LRRPVPFTPENLLNSDRLSFLYRHAPTFTTPQPVSNLFIFLKFYNYFNVFKVSLLL